MTDEDNFTHRYVDRIIYILKQLVFAIYFLYFFAITTNFYKTVTP